MFALRPLFFVKLPLNILGPTRLARYQSTVLSNALLSTVHRGTHFENRSIAVLEQHLSMSLRRVGGRGDEGIDMVGWWWIPGVESGPPPLQRRRIRVIAQCKAEKKKIGPKYIRELEGVLHRFLTPSTSETNIGLEDIDSHELADTNTQTAQLRQISSLGLFISESPFTKATVLRTQSSSIPLLLLHLPPEDEISALPSSKSELGAAIWNPALAGDQGLLGGQMEIRWERSIKGHNRPRLWWRKTKLCNWVPSEV